MRVQMNGCVVIDRVTLIEGSPAAVSNSPTNRKHFRSRTLKDHCSNQVESQSIPSRKVLLMKISARCRTRFEFRPRFPELFGNEMNDTIFNLQSSGDS